MGILLLLFAWAYIKLTPNIGLDYKDKQLGGPPIEARLNLKLGKPTMIPRVLTPSKFSLVNLEPIS